MRSSHAGRMLQDVCSLHSSTRSRQRPPLCRLCCGAAMCGPSWSLLQQSRFLRHTLVLVLVLEMSGSFTVVRWRYPSPFEAVGQLTSSEGLWRNATTSCVVLLCGPHRR